MKKLSWNDIELTIATDSRWSVARVGGIPIATVERPRVYDRKAYAFTIYATDGRMIGYSRTGLAMRHRVAAALNADNDRN